MLPGVQVTNRGAERHIEQDFADLYEKSHLYKCASNLLSAVDMVSTDWLQWFRLTDWLQDITNVNLQQVCAGSICALAFSRRRNPCTLEQIAASLLPLSGVSQAQPGHRRKSGAAGGGLAPHRLQGTLCLRLCGVPPRQHLRESRRRLFLSSRHSILSATASAEAKFRSRILG